LRLTLIRNDTHGVRAEVLQAFGVDHEHGLTIGRRPERCHNDVDAAAILGEGDRVADVRHLQSPE